MATSSKIKVMISSKCLEKFPNTSSGRVLSEIRKELEIEIEATTLFGKPLFEVWINETEDPQGGNWTNQEVCLNAVKDCDILISLYNGNAGWATTAGDVGICHAELSTGLDQAPGKVRLVSLGDITVPRDDAERQRNLRFKEYVDDHAIFRGREVTTEAELKERVKEAVFNAVYSLTLKGVGAASQGKFHNGEPLEWSTWTYQKRRVEICKVISNSIEGRPGSRKDGENIYAKIDDTEILFLINAIPDSIGVPQAKEMVGQPFLHDYEYFDLLSDDQGGPVHIIGCHKGATESQAKKLLGFPDATVVDAPFGVYVADNIQKVQFVFIRNCRDDTNTRHGVQLFFEWLKQNGEDERLAERAISRAKIAKLIAEVNGL